MSGKVKSNELFQKLPGVLIIPFSNHLLNVMSEDIP